MDNHCESNEKSKKELLDALLAMADGVAGNPDGETQSHYEFLIYSTKHYPELKKELAKGYYAIQQLVKRAIELDVASGRARETTDPVQIGFELSALFEGALLINEVYLTVNVQQYLAAAFEALYARVAV